MTNWTRARVDGWCGLCSSIIAKGDPVFEVRIPAVARVRWRCSACAGPAPTDLPPLVETPPTATPMVRVAQALPFDSKLRATGDHDD
jgi:hypothetical protein